MREIIYEFWKVNSVVSVHNNRHMVKIAKENILTQTDDSVDDIMPTESKKYQKTYFIHAISYSSSILPGGKPGTFIICIIYQFKTFLCKPTHNKTDGDLNYHIL